MARTIINLPLRNSVDESYNTAVNILQANGFKEVSYNGETVWKKGRKCAIRTDKDRFHFINHIVWKSYTFACCLGNLRNFKLFHCVNCSCITLYITIVCNLHKNCVLLLSCILYYAML